MAFLRLSIAVALACAAAGCSTTPHNTGKIDPTIASYVEAKDIKWVPNASFASVASLADQD